MNYFLNQEVIDLIERKCDQEIIIYEKHNPVMILLKYYVIQFYNTFLNQKSTKDREVVLSFVNDVQHIESLREYPYLNIKKIKNDIFSFCLEVCRFPVYVLYYFLLDSRYKNQIFEAYLKSHIIVNYAVSQKLKKVIFYGYDYYISFMIATLRLKQKGIKTVQYCNSGFLGVHNLEVADTVVFRTNIQVEYAQNNRDIFQSNHLFSLMPRYKIAKMKPHASHRIGVYTSGFYARKNFSKQVYRQRGIEAEKKMLDTLKRYAQQYQEVEIVLFIHLHNGIENREDAQVYYKDFLAVNNVRLQNEDEKSIDTFEAFGLAVTCLSEIFFDRIERGHKVILVNPFACEAYITQTALRHLSLYSENQHSIKKIESFREMSESSFFKLLS